MGITLVRSSARTRSAISGVLTGSSPSGTYAFLASTIRTSPDGGGPGPRSGRRRGRSGRRTGPVSTWIRSSFQAPARMRISVSSEQVLGRAGQGAEAVDHLLAEVGQMVQASAAGRAGDRARA